MKSIKNLIEDIYERVSTPVPFQQGDVEEFGKALARRLSNKLSEERGPQYLRLSNFGRPCDRQLWYSINQPERGEALPPAARIKFLIGDIAEELLLFLARASGHTLTDEQKEVEVAGVTGHIDGKIDGHLVDVKSASPFSFKKFKDHGLVDDDPFGYLGQLRSYGKAEGLKEGSFLVMDKVLGHLHLDTWELPDIDLEGLIDEKRKMLAGPIPPRHYTDEAFQKSGNRKLGVACSYCPFKSPCWPGLRTFIYSFGPV